MKNYLIIFVITILIILTSLIKTSTRNLESEIFNTKEKIEIVSNKRDLILLQNNYLSSPQRLFIFKKKFFSEELISIKSDQLKFLDKRWNKTMKKK